MGAITSVVKKKPWWDPMASEEWMEKHLAMEGEGKKAMDTNTGGSPGYLSQSQEPGTHLVMKWLDIWLQRAVGPGLYNT